MFNKIRVGVKWVGLGVLMEMTKLLKIIALIICFLYLLYLLNNVAFDLWNKYLPQVESLLMHCNIVGFNI